MKKYRCLTSRSPYVKGEVYREDKDNKELKLLVRLGYLEEVPMNYKKKKEVDEE